MKVLTGTVPVPDDANPARTLRQMYTYLFDLAEQIDYTLARQGVQLGRVSLPATQEQVDKLTALTDRLNATVTTLSTTVTRLSERVDSLTERVEAMTSTDTSTITARLDELQLKVGMHVTEYNDLLEQVHMNTDRIDELEDRVDEWTY